MATPKKKESPDDKITQLLDLVEQQKADIAEAERPVFRTNRTFSFVDGDLSKSVNLAVVSDVGQLLKMAAHVLAQWSMYQVASTSILGEEETPPKFTWNGFSDVDWLHDIKLRVSQIRLKAQREAYESQLADILEQGRREGSFIFDDLGLTMLAWFGIHNATYEVVRTRGADEVESIAAAFHRVFTEGVVERSA